MICLTRLVHDVMRKRSGEASCISIEVLVMTLVFKRHKQNFYFGPLLAPDNI
jgi:hypothetical protein